MDNTPGAYVVDINSERVAVTRQIDPDALREYQRVIDAIMRGEAEYASDQS